MLARGEHERLRAVVLDAAAKVLDLEPVAREFVQLLVVAVDDQLDDVLERAVHAVRQRLEAARERGARVERVLRGEPEPVVEVVLARRRAPGGGCPAGRGRRPARRPRPRSASLSVPCGAASCAVTARPCSEPRSTEEPCISIDGASWRL